MSRSIPRDSYMFRFEIWIDYSYLGYKGAQKLTVKAADERSARRIIEKKLRKHYGAAFDIKYRRIEKYD